MYTLCLVGKTRLIIAAKQSLPHWQVVDEISKLASSGVALSEITQSREESQLAEVWALVSPMLISESLCIHTDLVWYNFSHQQGEGRLYQEVQPYKVFTEHLTLSQGVGSQFPSQRNQTAACVLASWKCPRVAATHNRVPGSPAVGYLTDRQLSPCTLLHLLSRVSSLLCLIQILLLYLR